MPIGQDGAATWEGAPLPSNAAPEGPATEGTATERPAAPSPSPSPVPSIARRVTAALVAAGILLLALLGVGASWTYRLAVQEARSVTHGMAHLVASEVDRLFSAADLMLRQMAERAAETDWSRPDARAEAERRLLQLRDALPVSFRLFVWAPDGTLRAASVPESRPGLSAADRDYFRAHLDADAGLFVSEPLQARIDGTPIVVLSRRVGGPGGELLGVVSVSLESRELTRLYRALDLPEGWVVAWVHRSGRLLLREPAPPPVTPPRRAVPAEVQGAIAAGAPRGWVSYVSEIDGTARTAHFLSLPSGLPVYVMVGASDAEVRRAWARGALPYFAVGALATAGFALATLAARRWARSEDRHRAALAGMNADLERRVAARTAALVSLVTERDALLAQKDALIQEVNHRVKNSLQQVASMLRLQAADLPKGSMRQVVEDARSRVMAIGVVHERLYASDFTGRVEAQGYLRALCDEFRASAGPGCAVALEGEPVELPLARAVPLALMLNELLTNALKHARGPGGACSVRVSFGPDAEGALRLAVEDDGPGLPPGFDPGRARGLGMRLVQTFARQLGGRLEVGRGPGGTGARFAATFPAEPG
jgi:two-component sensor histidine kinase